MKKGAVVLPIGPLRVLAYVDAEDVARSLYTRLATDLSILLIRHLDTEGDVVVVPRAARDRERDEFMASLLEA